MTVIGGHVNFAKQELAGSPGLKSLQEIEKAAARAASLTAQLLAFSGKQVLQPRVLDCNAVVKAMENMLRAQIGENISLVTAFGSKKR